MYENLRDLQNAILNIAKEIHKICIENNIPYFMMGGTFIGAVRHKGFIPWDDDIDLGLTYENYKRLQNILFTMQHPWLIAESATLGSDTCIAFTKVYDKRTTLIEQYDDGEPRGVFVDIFPVCYGRNTKEDSIKEIKKAHLYRKLLERKKRNPYVNRPLLNVLTKGLVMFLSTNKIINKIAQQIEDLNSKTSDYLVALDGTSKDVYDKKYFSEPVILYKFEDTELYGIKDYDGFLTDVFHNYMQLPPEGKRVPHHIDFFDLDLPYQEYNKKSLKK